MPETGVERSTADVVDELRQFVHAVAPIPLATTPRSTSLVPPRNVKRGECSRAVASRPRSRPDVRRPRIKAVDQVGHQLHRVLFEAGAEILDQRGPARGVLSVGKGAGHRHRQLAQRDHPGHQVAQFGGRPVVDVAPANARTAENTSVAVDRIRSGPLRSKPSSAVT